MQTVKISIRRVLMTAIFVAVAHLASAQTFTASGTIVDNTGETVIGATVVEKGTNNATVTNIDGQFTLNVSKQGVDLEISYVGFTTLTLKAESNMNITMTEDMQELDELVVVGYQTQRKADLTGAVSVVNVKNMNTVPVTDPMQALQGKVAGMTITNSGNPSEDATVRIRGVGTMNDNSPLYVIDGMPTKNSIHLLNVNDIESIQVLKDAGSASIYGSRASNGVIIITTKRGRKGKLKVDVDMSYTASYYAHKMDVCNTEEYGLAMFTAYTNSGLDPNTNNLSYIFNWNEDLSNPQLSSMSYGKYNGYIDAEKTMRASDTDWFDEVTRIGSLKNISVSVSNGTDLGNYLFSLGYKDNEGIIKYTDYNSIMARMNSSYDIWKDHISVGENFTMTYGTNVDQNQQNLAEQALSIIPVHTEDGEGWGGPASGMNDRQNPLRLLYDGRNNRCKDWKLFGNAYISIKPIKGLELRSNFGLDYYQYFIRTLTYKYKNGFLSNDENNSALTQEHTTIWNWSNTANYNISFNDHNFSLLFGLEAYRKIDTSIYTYKKTYAVETLNYMWPDAGTGDAWAGGGESRYSLFSYFGKLDYNYLNQYLFSFTIRRDGSSRFGKNNRFGTFPAITFGWRLSEEKFIKNNIKWIDDLKLRVSWGKTGNQEGIDNYAHTGKWAPAYGSTDPIWQSPDYTSYDMNGTGSGTLPSGYVLTQRANENLRWEETIQSNVGLDFTLFGQCIYGSLDYYHKHTGGILLSPSYIGVIGEGGSQYVNGASLKNDGMDFTVGYRKTFANDLAIDVAGSLDFYRNKVVNVPESVINNYGGNGADDNIIGHTYGSGYGYVTDGLFTSQEEIDEYNAKYTYASGFITPGLGRIRYADINDDGIINEYDQTWIYDPTPDFSYGINISLSYKNFDLTLFWQGVQNVDYYNDGKASTDFFSVSETGSNKGTRMLNAWTTENSESTIPALIYSNTNNEGRYSTYFIEDGSFLKLRTLQLGCNLPISVAQKIRMSNCRLYINAQNLLTIHSNSFTGADPEVGSWSYPIPSSVSVGLQITF